MILQFNNDAEVVVWYDQIDFSKILNTGKFVFETLEANSKWLSKSEYKPKADADC